MSEEVSEKEDTATPRKRKAIVFVHGQGEHLPMQAARDLVESVFDPDDGEARYVPDTPGISSEASRIEVDKKKRETKQDSETDENQKDQCNLRDKADVDVFEYYWSHLKSGNRLTDVWLWFRRLIFISFDKTPEPIQPVRQTVIFFAEIAAIFLAAFAMLTASVMFHRDLDVSYPDASSRFGATDAAHADGVEGRQASAADDAVDPDNGMEDDGNSDPQQRPNGSSNGDDNFPANADQLRAWNIQNKLYNLRTRFDIHPSDETLERVALRQIGFKVPPLREPYLIERFNTPSGPKLAIVSKVPGVDYRPSTTSTLDIIDYTPAAASDQFKTIEFKGIALDLLFFAESTTNGSLTYSTNGEPTHVAIGTAGKTVEIFSYPVADSTVEQQTIDLDKVCSEFRSDEYVARVELLGDHIFIQGDEGFIGSVAPQPSGEDRRCVPLQQTDAELSRILESSEGQRLGAVRVLGQTNLTKLGFGWGHGVSTTDQDDNIIYAEQFDDELVLLRRRPIFDGTQQIVGSLELWSLSEKTATKRVEDASRPSIGDFVWRDVSARWDGGVTRIKNLSPPAFANGGTRNALPISRVMPLIFVHPCQGSNEYFSLYYQSNTFDDGPPLAAHNSNLPRNNAEEEEAFNIEPDRSLGASINIDQYLVEGGPIFMNTDKCDWFYSGNIYTQQQKIEMSLVEPEASKFSFVNMSATTAKVAPDEISKQHLIIASVIKHQFDNDDDDNRFSFSLRLDGLDARTGASRESTETGEEESPGGRTAIGEDEVRGKLRPSSSYTCKLGRPDGDTIVGLSVSTAPESPSDRVRLAVATPLGVALEQFRFTASNKIVPDRHNDQNSGDVRPESSELCKFTNWLTLPDNRQPHSVTISDDGGTLVVLDNKNELHLFSWPQSLDFNRVDAESSSDESPTRVSRALRDEDSVRYDYELFSDEARDPERVSARWLSRLINLDYPAYFRDALDNQSATLKTCRPSSRQACFEGVESIERARGGKPLPKCRRGDDGVFEFEGCEPPKEDSSLHIVQFVSDDLLMVTLPGGVVLQEVTPSASGKRKLGQAFWLASSNMSAEAGKEAEAGEESKGRNELPEYAAVKAGVLLDPETSLVAHGGTYGPAYANPDIELIALQSATDRIPTPYEAVRFKVSDAAPYPTMVRGLLMLTTVAAPFIVIATILAIILNHWIVPIRKYLLRRSEKELAKSKQAEVVFPRPINRFIQKIPPLAESSIVFFGLLIAAVGAGTLSAVIQFQSDWFISEEDGDTWRERTAFLVMAVASGAVLMIAVQLAAKVPNIYASVRRFIIEEEKRKAWRQIAWAMTSVVGLLFAYTWISVGAWALILLAAGLLAIWNPDILKWFAQIVIYIAIPIAIVSLIFHSLSDPRYGSNIITIYTLLILGLVALSLVWARRLIPAILVGAAALPLTLGSIIGLGLQGLAGGPGVANVFIAELDQLYAAVLAFTIVSAVAMAMLAKFKPSHTTRGLTLLVVLAVCLAFYVARVSYLLQYLVYGLIIAGPAVGSIIWSRHRQTDFRIILAIGAVLLGGLLAFAASRLVADASAGSYAYELLLEKLLALYPAWTIACLFMIAVFAGVGWIVSRSFLVPIMADTARYLSERPKDVKLARQIREQGVAFFNDLHASKRYEEIIVVAHSLGSIIALDILSQVWSRRNTLLSRQGDGQTGGTRSQIAEKYVHIDKQTRKLQERFKSLTEKFPASERENSRSNRQEDDDVEVSQQTIVMDSLDEFLDCFESYINQNKSLHEDHLDQLVEFGRRLRLEGPSCLPDIVDHAAKYGLDHFSVYGERRPDSDTEEGAQSKDAEKGVIELLKEAANAFGELQKIDEDFHQILREPIGSANEEPVWAVSRFVTLGSPLTYGSYLLGDVRAAYYPKSTRPLKLDSDDEDSGVQSEDEKQKAVNLSDILPTRWTNIFFPTNEIVVGDIVSGPIWRHFGSGVKEVELKNKYPNGYNFAHNQYWKSAQRSDVGSVDIPGRPDARGRSEHLIPLRKALNSIST